MRRGGEERYGDEKRIGKERVKRRNPAGTRKLGFNSSFA
jgi:hypothetical protein